MTARISTSEESVLLQYAYHSFDESLVPKYKLFDEIEVKESKEMEKTVIKTYFPKVKPLLTELDLMTKRYITSVATCLLKTMSYHTAEPIARNITEYLDGKDFYELSKVIPDDTTECLDSCACWACVFSCGLINCCFNLDRSEKPPLDQEVQLQISNFLKIGSFDGSCKSILELAKESDLDSLLFLLSMARIDKFFALYTCNDQYKSHESDLLGQNLMNCLRKSLHLPLGTRATIVTAFLAFHPILSFSWSHRYLNTCFGDKYDDLPLYLLNSHVTKAVENNEMELLTIFLKSGIPSLKFILHFEKTIESPFTKIIETKFYAQHVIFHPNASRQTIRFWLSNGVSPDIKFDVDAFREERHSITLLLFAIMKKDRNLIDLLLSYKADMHAPCVIAGLPITPYEYALNVGFTLVSEKKSYALL